MAEDKKHPLTGTGTSAKYLDILKENPIFSILAGLFLLAFIVPPRRRKYKNKPKRRRSTKRNPGNPCLKNPGNSGKKKKGKKSKKGTVQKKKRTIKSGNKAPWMVAGSKAAKDHMAHLRAMRSTK